MSGIYWLAIVLISIVGTLITYFILVTVGVLVWGTVGTSAPFLTLILSLVIYLTVTRLDMTPAEVVQEERE